LYASLLLFSSRSANLYKGHGAFFSAGGRLNVRSGAERISEFAIVYQATGCVNIPGGGPLLPTGGAARFFFKLFSPDPAAAFYFTDARAILIHGHLFSGQRSPSENNFHSANLTHPAPPVSCRIARAGRMPMEE
jgi:hypothetical protein